MDGSPPRANFFWVSSLLPLVLQAVQRVGELGSPTNSSSALLAWHAVMQELEPRSFRFLLPSCSFCFSDGAQAQWDKVTRGAGGGLARRALLRRLDRSDASYRN